MTNDEREASPRAARFAPWIAGGLALAAALAGALPRGATRGFDLDAFGRLPVLEGGRVKPIDSVARNALLAIRGKQSVPAGGSGAEPPTSKSAKPAAASGASEGAAADRTVLPDEWLLDAMFRPDVADAQPVFFINDPDVLGLIGLRQSSDRYFSFNTLLPHLAEIQRQAESAHAIDAKQQTRFQAAISNLFERVYLYYRLRNTVQLGDAPLAREIAARTASDARERQAALAQLAFFRPLPPLPGGPPGAWRTVGEALRAPTADADPVLRGWAQLSTAYASQDAAAFDRAAASIGEFIAAAQPDDLRQAGYELVFNRAQPFYAGMVIYVLALLVLFVSWLWKPRLLQPAAFGLLAAGALVHTAGLVSRIVLQGRPPVTNLYSSAVFVGWCAVLLGVVLERIYRRGFATAVAAAAGFASLIVAHHLTGDGDTMEMMRAVLDSNFWLATHVVTITIGYSGTFLAGALAIAYVLRRHVVRRPDPASTRTLVSMTYGVVCFALLFSFVGTVLGGIWADQSWGRFWGWDPKENGALLIVLWNAIILHARWGGYARERGFMAMAIFGNVITSLSWFGVNMLGVGLHSYGFMDKAFWPLAGFIGSQLALIPFCFLPPRFWARAAATEQAAPAGGG